MFDKITIHLENPLCKCTKTKVPSWGLIQEDKQVCLRIFCKDCKITLNIPFMGIAAQFSYPLEKEKDKPAAKILKLLPENTESDE